VSMRDLAERIIALCGATRRWRHLPLPVDDPAQRQPDIALAALQLGWAPRIGLQEGLLRTVDDFRRRLAVAAG
jgi:UDP-glucuronate decarboxylase